jgi:glutathione synthase/RimK-type ligase-like ATP-grasp enzyme
LRADAADPACAAHLEALLAGGDVLVQPFIPSVAADGEVSLIYFGGQFCHAIRKRPAEGDFRVQDMYGGTVHAYSPAADEVELATIALAATPAPTTYARVDIVRLPDGRPAVMELELIEPELFLGATPDAAMRFAEVLRDYPSQTA